MGCHRASLAGCCTTEHRGRESELALWLATGYPACDRPRASSRYTRSCTSAPRREAAPALPPALVQGHEGVRETDRLLRRAVREHPLGEKDLPWQKYIWEAKALAWAAHLI